MRDHSVAISVPEKSAADLAVVTELAKGIEVVELTDRKERKLSELRSHIDDMLADGWHISARNPLTLQQGSRTCYVLHGMLISDSLI